MTTLKLILLSSVLANIGIFFAELDTASTIALVSGLVSAIFGGWVLVITTKSKSKIEEMRAQAELERVKNEAHQKVMEVRSEAQKAVSLVNTAALSNLHSAMTANTAETLKSVAAADQAKQRVEQLVDKLPPVQRSETDTPVDVHVVNPPADPVNTRPQ